MRFVIKEERDKESVIELFLQRIDGKVVLRASIDRGIAWNLLQLNENGVAFATGLKEIGLPTDVRGAVKVTEWR